MLPDSFFTFNIFGKTIELSYPIIVDYKDLTGTDLTDKIIENEINATFYKDFVDTMTKDQLEKIAERTIRDTLYEPYVSLPLYNGTKLVTIDKKTVHLFTNVIPFTAKYIESLMRLSEYRETAPTLSNEELSKAVEDRILQEVYDTVNIMGLEGQMREKWKKRK